MTRLIIEEEWVRNRNETMAWLAYELLKLLRIVSIRRELALDAFT